MKIIKQHFDSLELCKVNLESAILEISEPYLKKIELVLSVPAIKNPFSAIAIIFKIGFDMSVFTPLSTYAPGLVLLHKQRICW